MEHIDTEFHLTAEQKLFNDFIQRAEDFMKIEIYRSAKKCYIEALDTHVNDELSQQKIMECDQLIRKESNIIITIIAVAAVIVGAVFIIALT
jgi:hypothetical protein